MEGVRPQYLLALGLVVVLGAWIMLSNPHRKYSRQQFWEDATVATVAEVPDEALEPGNRNGPVVMWAAMSTDDPEIVRRLVERGADINETDGIFKGTPLSAVAAHGEHPHMLDALVELGADVGVRLHENRTVLMNAAAFNRNPGIAARLIELGVDPHAVDDDGRTALDLAREFENDVVAEEIERAIR